MAIDSAIARIAAAQHGVISLAQLNAVGLSSSAVRGRVAAGRLIRVHRGVYAVGHARLTQKGRWMAGVLAGGDAALLAGRASAHLQTLTFHSGMIEILTPGSRGRTREGLIIHSAELITTADVHVVDGIPCTDWARTTIDIACTRPRAEIENALDRTETLRIFDLGRLDEALETAGARKGTRVVREILGSGYTIGADITESVREDDFFALCDRFGIPRPLCNRPMLVGDQSIRPDFWWPDVRLVVEVDGYGTHGTRSGFKSDRQRDRNVLINSNIALLRFDAAEVRDQAATVARDVTAMRGKLVRR